MAEQYSTGSFQSPYKFNGKLQRSENPDASGELDAISGLYYYGARYYDPRSSVWLSVDPMLEKYAGWSPYNYTLGNPVKFADTDVRDIKIYYQVHDKKGNSLGYKSWNFNGKNFSQAPSDRFVKNVLAAYKYNVKHGGGETNSDLSITIMESKEDNNSWGGVEMKSKKGDWVEKVVLFNPNSGSMTSDGHELSPATTLDEEFDHAINSIEDPKGNWDRYRTRDKDYDNKEERRAKLEGTVKKQLSKTAKFPKTGRKKITMQNLFKKKIGITKKRCNENKNSGPCHIGLPFLFRSF